MSYSRVEIDFQQFTPIFLEFVFIFTILDIISPFLLACFPRSDCFTMVKQLILNILLLIGISSCYANTISWPRAVSLLQQPPCQIKGKLTATLKWILLGQRAVYSKAEFAGQLSSTTQPGESPMKEQPLATTSDAVGGERSPNLSSRNNSVIL